MRRLDLVAVGQVGDCPRELQDAVTGAGAEIQLLHRRFDQLPPSLVQLAELSHFGRPHVGIHLQIRPRKALPRPLSRLFYLSPNRRRRLAQPIAAQLFVLHARYGDMDIDAVEQRAGDAVLAENSIRREISPNRLGATGSDSF